MLFKDIENIISGLVMDLEPVLELSADAMLYEIVNFNCSENDNTKWIELITKHLQRAKSFEIHCWNDETGWIELALQYGRLKKDSWKHGKVITGEITPQ